LFDVDLPGIGNVEALSGRSNDTDFFYKYTSFSDPGAIYHIDLDKTTKSKELWNTKLPAGSPNPKNFITDRVYYPSKDGTKIPMFLIRKKSILPSMAE
jgi:prolyl oligopeptidase